VKLASVKGITPVSTQSVEDTERELIKLIIESRGAESAHDPGIALAARDAADLAHANGAGLVAVVEHPNADPAVLVGMIVTADAPLGPDAADELRAYLEDSGGPDIREVTQARTDRGYPVIITERILVESPLRTGPPTGCQLQAVVLEPNGRTMAVFTLHSVTGRGWLDLSALLGQLVSTVDFT
jgi:nucleotide-binding universal stress UspA family protein